MEQIRGSESWIGAIDSLRRDMFDAARRFNAAGRPLNENDTGLRTVSRVLTGDKLPLALHRVVRDLDNDRVTLTIEGGKLPYLKLMFSIPDPAVAILAMDTTGNIWLEGPQWDSQYEKSTEKQRMICAQLARREDAPHPFVAAIVLSALEWMAEDRD